MVSLISILKPHINNRNILMKKLIISAFLLSISFSVSAQESKKVIKLSEPVKVTETYEVYGSDSGNIEDSKTLTSAILDLENETVKDVVISSTIAQVCEKKGCFFIAQDDQNQARVTFIDYSFFIPTDSQGKSATIVGKLSKKVLSEEQAKHYAEDAGKNPDDIKGEQAEYSIVATSIVLQKSK